MKRQFLIYVGVGVLSAIVDIGSMQALLWLAFDHRIAVTVGFAVGLVFNYLCHERFTFRAKRSTATFVRFAVLVLMNYGLTLLCVQLGVALLDSVLAGKLVSLPIIAANGFLWGRYWIFRQRRD
jgi:putative flippase GtrA